MKTPKTDVFVENLRKICGLRTKKAEKSQKMGQKTAKMLVKRAQMRVFIKNLREYASVVNALNNATARDHQ